MALSDRVAVMERGSILQIAPPEIIYQRPQSIEVARFFGDPNVLNAFVEARVPSGVDTFEVSVRGEDWWGRCLAGEPFESGSQIVVMVRPENLVLIDPGAASEGMTWRGRVIESVFRGSRRSLTVDVAGRNLHVEAPAMRSANVGDNVVVKVAAEHAWAMRLESLHLADVFARKVAQSEDAALVDRVASTSI